MEVLAVELMATELVAAMKLVAAVKPAMESTVPTTSGQRGCRHRCHCQDRNC
jgi:hypothetical protein